MKSSIDSLSESFIIRPTSATQPNVCGLTSLFIAEVKK
ncbi:MAG: hypothetical protein ACJAWS_002053 [Oleiphilaceae bacterium]|jgi:hypothetical protein